MHIIKQKIKYSNNMLFRDMEVTDKLPGTGVESIASRQGETERMGWDVLF